MQVVGIISAGLGVGLRTTWLHHVEAPWLGTMVVFPPSVMSLKEPQRWWDLSFGGSEIGNTAPRTEGSDPLPISL